MYITPGSCQKPVHITAKKEFIKQMILAGK
jgi:hypothetical protein